MKRLLTMIPRDWLLYLYEQSMDECFRRGIISWISEHDEGEHKND